MGTAWHDRFEEAKSVDETVEAMRQYLTTLEPGERQMLPKACRAEAIRHDDDIDGLTYRLADPNRELQDDRAVQEVFGHFLHASLRISHLRRAQMAQSMGPRRFSPRQMG